MTFDKKKPKPTPTGGAQASLAEIESGIEPVQDGRIYIDPPPNCRERIKSGFEPQGSRRA
jgi:hypothetical protein